MRQVCRKKRPLWNAIFSRERHQMSESLGKLSSWRNWSVFRDNVGKKVSLESHLPVMKGKNHFNIWESYLLVVTEVFGVESCKKVRFSFNAIYLSWKAQNDRISRSAFFPSRLAQSFWTRFLTMIKSESELPNFTRTACWVKLRNITHRDQVERARRAGRISGNAFYPARFAQHFFGIFSDRDQIDVPLSLVRHAGKPAG